MCRWLSYKGAPIYLEDLIRKPVHSLIQQSLHAAEAKAPTNGDGFGVGWYGDREQPGLYREVLPAWNDPNLLSLAHQIRSGLFFAHVRASTGTETIRPNCHPFNYGRWLFMHNGQIGGYAKVRRRLESLIPDDLYGHRVGTTDSEAVFYLLLANGVEQDALGAWQTTLAQIESVMRDAGIGRPFRCTAAMTDGQRLIAVRYASDDAPPSLYYCWDDQRLIVVSEPLDETVLTWNPVPPNHFLIAEGDAAPLVQEVSARAAA